MLAALCPDPAACTSAPPGVANGNYTSQDAGCTGSTPAPLGKQCMVTCADGFYPTSDSSAFIPQVTATCGAIGWELNGYCAQRSVYCLTGPSLPGASKWRLTDTVTYDDVESGTPCESTAPSYGVSCMPIWCTGSFTVSFPGITAICTPPALESQWQPYWEHSGGQCFTSKRAGEDRWGAPRVRLYVDKILHNNLTAFKVIAV